MGHEQSHQSRSGIRNLPKKSLENNEANVRA